MKHKGTFWKTGITLLILGALCYGGYYAYQRFFADAPAEGTVYVQSVAVITGVGPAGVNNRYTGVVEAKNVIKVDPDKDLTIKECFVAAGDKVQVGTALFCYDVDSLQLSYEQLQLDILGLENAIKTGGEKVENLKKQLARARESKKYDIQMNIQTQELEIRKKQYELQGKQEQALAMEKALQNSTVYSTVAGTVRSVKSADGGAGMGYGDGVEESAYITIVAGNDYCVKGTVSEQTIRTLREGMPVRVTSRVDDTLWRGRIYRINTEEVKQTNRYYYYDEGSGERASKYEFFVELDSIEGLLMGQHVYIEPGDGQEGEGETGLLLPAYYVVEEGDRAYVYAADENNRVEKRYVELGRRDEENGTWEILSGLSYLDRIAFPDESVKVGMGVSETSYVPEGGMDGMDGFDGMDMDGMMPGMDMDGMMPGMDMDGNGPETGETHTDGLEGMDLPQGDMASEPDLEGAQG